MILSDILGSAVLDAAGATAGKVVDARFVLTGGQGGAGNGGGTGHDGENGDSQEGVQGTPGQARLRGLVVSEHGSGSFLGYERSNVNSPWLIGRIMQWRQRGSFLVAWEDIARIDVGTVTLRAGYRRLPAQLAE